METEVAVGVDACPMGWIATMIAGNRVECETFSAFEEVEARHGDASQVLVDIPIGLPDAERRQCDVKARELLGSRGLSVFFPPCQAALEESKYSAANRVHRTHLGYGLSQQAHSIREKIAEVGGVVDGVFDGVIRESHPELCFAALNGQPVAYSKSSARGRDFRLQLLADEVENAAACYEETRERYLLKEVRRDDILDSMALAVAARTDVLETVPESPVGTEPRMYYPSFEIPGMHAP